MLNHCFYNADNLPAPMFYFPLTFRATFASRIRTFSFKHLFHASSSVFNVVLEFTLKVYTVWRVMLCLLLTLLSDPLWRLWATEYFNALLIIDYEAVVFVPDMSNQLIDRSTSKSFYFWKSLCVNPLMPAVCTCFSFHRVYWCLCVFVGFVALSACLTPREWNDLWCF